MRWLSLEHLNPLIVNDIVLSVPHSGTRTLQRWLKDEQEIVRETQPDPNEMVGHWHFGMHTNRIQEMFEDGHGNGHIPLRNPIDICDSWRRRYSKDPNPGKTQGDLNHAITLMVVYLSEFPNRTQVYKMEELPNLIGAGPEQDLSSEEIYYHERTQDLRRFILGDNLVREFYQWYYTEEELWWM